MNMDPRACYGRFVVDCAGLGVPCIGKDRTVMQGTLFPDLTTPWLDCEPTYSPETLKAAAGLAWDLLRQRYNAQAIRKRFYSEMETMR